MLWRERGGVNEWTWQPRVGEVSHSRQCSSSLLSEQSSSSSHRHGVGIHLPFLHRNCPVSQAVSLPGNKAAISTKGIKKPARFTHCSCPRSYNEATQLHLPVRVNNAQTGRHFPMNATHCFNNATHLFSWSFHSILSAKMALGLATLVHGQPNARKPITRVYYRKRERASTWMDATTVTARVGFIDSLHQYNE